MVSTLAPRPAQNARSFSTAPASVPSGGVRMHQRLMKSSAKPESGPECSVPATGCAGGDAEDDEVGVFDGFRIGLDHAIGETKLHDAGPRLFRAGGRDDLADQALRARAARDRAADQAEADQRDPFEEWVAAHDALMNSRRPSTTRRFASSRPMVMRSACGRR